MLDETKRFVCAKDVLFRVLDGEAVLLNLESGTYFGMNEIATRVWELLNQGKVIGEIRNALADEFEVARDVLEKDLDELFEQLEKRGLVLVGSHPAG